MQLRLTDYTTTVNLNDFSQAGTLKYVPQTPKWTAEVVPGTSSGIDTLPGGRYDAVTESWLGDLLGSAATMRSTLNTIGQLIYRATAWSSGSRGTKIAPVYLEFKPLDSDSTWYRSPVSFIQIDLDEEALDWQLPLNTRTRVTLTWTRAPYWERSTETELGLTTAIQTKRTGGVNIYSADVNDASSASRWYVDGADVAGDLPAPLRLKLVSGPTVGAYYMTDIRIGQSIWADMATIYNYAAVPLTYFKLTGTTVNWSGTNVQTLTTQTLATTLSAAYGGALVRPVMRFASGTTSDATMRAYYTISMTNYSGTAILYTSPYVSVYKNPVMEMPAMHLPPDYYGSTNNVTYTINVYAISNTAGAHSLGLLSLSIPPMERWRRYDLSNFPLPLGYGLVDDPVVANAYTIDGSSKNSGAIRVFGDAMIVVPGRRTDYMLTHSASDGTTNDTSVLVTQAYYRPRRLAL